MIKNHLATLSNFSDIHSSKYKKMLILGDFNAGIDASHMKYFCEAYNLTNLIKQPACYKNPDNSTCIDLILTIQLTQTSLRGLRDVLKRSQRLTTKQDVVTTSGKWRRIYNVLKTFDLHRLGVVQFTTSWSRPIYNVLKTSDLHRLEDVWFTFSWRRQVYDVLKTSDLRHLEDVQFRTSWKCLIYVVFKTSNLGRLENVWFTSSWRRPI